MTSPSLGNSVLQVVRAFKRARSIGVYTVEADVIVGPNFFFHPHHGLCKSSYEGSMPVFAPATREERADFVSALKQGMVDIRRRPPRSAYGATYPMPAELLHRATARKIPLFANG
jgi:hypothetical protein